MPRANPAAPVWSWADDHSSATATFTCTDSRCKHQETVDANVTSEKQTGKITYTATTEMNGRTYTDTKETDREYFVGHSLSLNGDIGVNFYLDLTDREIADGAKAQLTFDRNTDALANGGTDYFTDTVNASDIASTMSNMTENLSSYGLEYTGTTIVYLTETSIRHYYTITDQDTFDLVKDNITFDGVKVGYTKKGNEICFEKKGVAATFRYNQAANTYFGR